ncbi:subtilisin-like protease [Pyrus ussuriensis x Pyrus communis]|uniref:Subtilisin-like protease n=1 Tax=Pyrus ussuriensis x Pyrus communis TaxID=2448454 RepID=A0A5N5HNW8_9ROSA|nr:subtilisin-like protease [Pyrus ussuriensis x Pyrus communis]
MESRTKTQKSARNPEERLVLAGLRDRKTARKGEIRSGLRSPRGQGSHNAAAVATTTKILFFFPLDPPGDAAMVEVQQRIRIPLETLVKDLEKIIQTLAPLGNGLVRGWRWGALGNRRRGRRRRRFDPKPISGVESAPFKDKRVTPNLHLRKNPPGLESHADNNSLGVPESRHRKNESSSGDLDRVSLVTIKVSRGAVLRGLIHLAIRGFKSSEEETVADQHPLQPQRRRN